MKLPIVKAKPVVEHRETHIRDLFSAAFLVTRGCRCRRYEDSFIFTGDVRQHLNEFKEGAPVVASEYAKVLDRLINPTVADVLAGGPQI